MQDSSLILSECEDINALLYKPIIAAQRISYTCINVSPNHIVLGSTSGSLYLFTREPCTFQQVIPLSEGAVTHVCTSPDEKLVALSTKRGSVCVLSLKPAVKLLSTSKEHLNETVTCLCWNSKSSEIYIGDSSGKISTIVFSIFPVNAIFQAPICALMYLESSIVQIDYSIHYLLVSTRTRCYICDTTQEEFKQIGNKPRNGDFGACFIKKPSVVLEEPNVDEESVANKAYAALNSLIRCNDDKNILIYCVRPGFRLWEVTPDGFVTKTHQFRNALNILPSEIFRSSNVKSIYGQKQEEKIETFNFSCLHVIDKKYLISYANNSLYIIDPVNASVVLWTNKLDSIAMAQICNDKIYLMGTNGVFHCLTLSSIDSLILRLFEMKLYSDCMNTCVNYRSDLMRLIHTNRHENENENSIHSELNGHDNELISILEPIILVIQSNFNTQSKRLNSGIVVVNSGHHQGDYYNEKYETDFDYSSDSEIVCNDVKIKKKNTKSANQMEIEQVVNNLSEMKLDDNLENQLRNSENMGQSVECEKNGKTNDRKSSDKSNIQADIQLVCVLINTLKSSMSIDELEATIFNILKSIQDVKFKYEDDVCSTYADEVLIPTENLYFQTLLENINLELLNSTESDYVINEVIRAFVLLNSSTFIECDCGYRRFAYFSELNFIEVGRCLIRRLAKDNKARCIKLFKSIPRILREDTSFLTDQEILDEVLPLCIHSRDTTILSTIFLSTDERRWKIVRKLIERMQAGECLQCGKYVNMEESIDWSAVTNEIMKKKGMEVAMEFLVTAEKYVPMMKLQGSIFQSFIFTKLLKKHGFDGSVNCYRTRNNSNMEFRSICSIEIREKLVKALEKDLKRPVSPDVLGKGAHHWGIKYKPVIKICPCCTLPHQTPILLKGNGLSIFPCGHAYHINCLIEKKITKCYLHSSH